MAYQGTISIKQCSPNGIGPPRGWSAAAHADQKTRGNALDTGSDKVFGQEHWMAMRPAAYQPVLGVRGLGDAHCTGTNYHAFTRWMSPVCCVVALSFSAGLSIGMHTHVRMYTPRRVHTKRREHVRSFETQTSLPVGLVGREPWVAATPGNVFAFALLGKPGYYLVPVGGHHGGVYNTGYGRADVTGMLFDIFLALPPPVPLPLLLAPSLPSLVVPFRAPKTFGVMDQ